MLRQIHPQRHRFARDVFPRNTTALNGRDLKCQPAPRWETRAFNFQGSFFCLRTKQSCPSIAARNERSFRKIVHVDGQFTSGSTRV